MIINNITPPQVWSASARSLTNIGSGALAPTSTLTTSLAASASVDFRPSAGTVGQITVGVKTGAAATVSTVIDTTDGTLNIVAVTTGNAANAMAAFTITTTNAVWARAINNDGVNAAQYQASAFVWTI